MSDEQTTYDDPPSVHVLIGRVLAELPSIGKDDEAPADMGGYKFRGIESITAALKPLFGKHGLFVIPSTIDRQESVRKVGKYEKNMYVVDVHVRFTFYGPGGDWLECSTWGEGTDMGDKATQKAYTAAFKSMLAVAFTIADSETDAERHSVPDSTTAPELLDAERREALRERINALSGELRAELRQRWVDTTSLKPYTLDELPAVHEDLVSALVSGIEAQARAAASAESTLGASESEQAQLDVESTQQTPDEPDKPAEQSVDELLKEAVALIDADEPEQWVRVIVDTTAKMSAADVDGELRNWSLPKSGNLATRRRRLAIAQIRDNLRPPS